MKAEKMSTLYRKPFEKRFLKPSVILLRNKFREFEANSPEDFFKQDLFHKFNDFSASFDFLQFSSFSFLLDKQVLLFTKFKSLYCDIPHDFFKIVLLFFRFLFRSFKLVEAFLIYLKTISF
jgi:hypothetical protein